MLVVMFDSFSLFRVAKENVGESSNGGFSVNDNGHDEASIGKITNKNEIGTMRDVRRRHEHPVARSTGLSPMT